MTATTHRPTPEQVATYRGDQRLIAYLASNATGSLERYLKDLDRLEQHQAVPAPHGMTVKEIRAITESEQVQMTRTFRRLRETQAKLRDRKHPREVP